MDRRIRRNKILKAMGYKKHRQELKNRDRELDRGRCRKRFSNLTRHMKPRKKLKSKDGRWTEGNTEYLKSNRVQDTWERIKKQGAEAG